MKEMILQIPGISGHKTASVEAGHFYANETIGHEQEIGVEVGKAVLEVLSEIGIKATTCLLIDDYHAHDTGGIIEGNVKQLGKLGFVPEMVFSEKRMISEAWGILGDLTKLGKVKDKRDGRRFLKDGWIHLADTIYPTCSLMDAALYKTKHGMFSGVCVTVLPGSYIDQQEKTKQILKSAGLKIPILNVFFNSEGKVSLEFE